MPLGLDYDDYYFGAVRIGVDEWAGARAAID
jgi:hypothetical protein